jgi:hypothetical protein
VALFKAKELRKCHLLYFMNLFMNKNNGSQFKLNIKLNWKTTNTTPKDPMVVM